MTEAAQAGSGATNSLDALATAIATFAYVNHAGGTDGEGALPALCAAVSGATDSKTGEDAANALVSHIRGLLTGAGPAEVTAALAALYGARVATDLGVGDREARVHRIRKYQFSHNLPWLARIWERQEDGSVGPSWVIVNRVTDEVTAMDPNPWNDIDEERHFPVGDFQVLWELDGCTSLHLG